MHRTGQRAVSRSNYATYFLLTTLQTPSARYPLRREVARVAIERLIEDGRVHPARIEEVTAKVREEVETAVVEAGEAAALELGLAEIHPRLHRHFMAEARGVTVVHRCLEPLAFDARILQEIVPVIDFDFFSPAPDP